MKVQNKVVVVTGGGNGMGREVVRNPATRALEHPDRAGRHLVLEREHGGDIEPVL